jgi:hypothetical protein
MNMKIVAIVWLLALPLTARQKPPSPRNPPAPGKVIELVDQGTPVVFQEPVEFWRAGKQEQAQQGLVLRVRVDLPLEDFGRNSLPPQFLLGHGVCHLLKGPVLDGVVVLLAPLPKPGEPAVLSIAPGIAPQKLDERFLRANPPSQHGVPITLPAKTVQPKSYQNLLELRRQVAPVPGERKPQ